MSPRSRRSSTRWCPQGADVHGCVSACGPSSASRHRRPSSEENFAAWPRFLELMRPTRDRLCSSWRTSLGRRGPARLRRAPAVPGLVPLLSSPRRGRSSCEQREGDAHRRRRRPSAARHLARLWRAAAGRSSATLSAPGSERSAVQIVDLVGGNPLFAEQFVGCCSTAACGASGRRPAPRARHRPTPCPRPCRRCPRRASNAPRRHKALLCDASVIGETFSRAASRRSPEQDGAGRRAAMAPSSTATLSDPSSASSMEGETEYLFWRALARTSPKGNSTRVGRASAVPPHAGSSEQTGVRAWRVRRWSSPTTT